MAYRNGTYVAFHAEGTSNPIESDMRYYRLVCAWHANEDIEFDIINSHEKTAAVRDTSKRSTLRTRILERLRNSRNMLLIIGNTTYLDNDWVPFEIASAIDNYQIPIIAAYPNYNRIQAPAELHSLWPSALETRINQKTARVIHVPFKKEPIKDALSQFDYKNLPTGGLNYYDNEAYKAWGLL